MNAGINMSMGSYINPYYLKGPSVPLTIHTLASHKIKKSERHILKPVSSLKSQFQFVRRMVSRIIPSNLLSLCPLSLPVTARTSRLRLQHRKDSSNRRSHSKVALSAKYSGCGIGALLRGVCAVRARGLDGCVATRSGSRGAVRAAIAAVAGARVARRARGLLAGGDVLRSLGCEGSEGCHGLVA